MKAGQVTVRPGGVRHCGHAVESGTRYIIGGFCLHRNKPEAVRMLLNNLDSEPNEIQKLALEAAVALNPACDAAYNLLAHHYETVLNDKQKAQEVLEYCLSHANDSSGEVAYALSSLYLDQKDYDNAESCLETCLEVDPADVDALLSLAQCSSAKGNVSREQQLYERIIATPTGSNDVLAQAYCNLGVLQEGTNAELECFRKSLALKPANNFSSQYSLACALASRQEWKDAIVGFKLAVDQADNEQNGIQSLQQLYKAAVHMIRTEMTNSEPPPSQAAMTRNF